LRPQSGLIGQQRFIFYGPVFSIAPVGFQTQRKRCGIPFSAIPRIGVKNGALEETIGSLHFGIRSR